MMANVTILLVEDNPDAEEVTLRAFEQQHITDQVLVARDVVDRLLHVPVPGCFNLVAPLLLQLLEGASVGVDRALVRLHECSRRRFE